MPGPAEWSDAWSGLPDMRSGWPPAARNFAPEAGAGESGDIADAVVLAVQSAATRLLAAGLDLNSSMRNAASGPGPDGPAGRRLPQAISEIDAAIRDLQHLVYALSVQRPGPGWTGR